MQQRTTEEQGLLGKLGPGEKKLEGKTFYLDGVKKRSTALLLEAITLHGGRIESFLHKDVSFVVTESQEGPKEQKCSNAQEGTSGTKEEPHCPLKQQERVLSSDRQRPVTPRPVACGSRGKALLEKAIRNSERLQGSVLANAQSWGVKILHVNDVLLYLKLLTRESFSVKSKRHEKSCTKQQGCVVKATALRSPYLKIEDSSRKFKPLHLQSMTFPSLCYLGRFSPFESRPPPFEKRKEQEENKTREKTKAESSIQNKCETPLSCNPSPWRPRRKDLSYCECCHQHFNNLEEHLQSDQHRSFVLDSSNYSAVDQLVIAMFPEFDPNPCQQSEQTSSRPPTPLPVEDFCDLEPLSDIGMEDGVWALQPEGAAQIPSPCRVPPSFCSAGPSADDQLPNPNPAALPADIQSFTSAGIQPHTFSPVMPVLDTEPQPHPSACQPPDNLSPYPMNPCVSSDPYLLAPVLSPQLLNYSDLIEVHGSYSDPPVLSPQQYAVVEEDTCESVPPPSEPVTNADGAKVSNLESPLVFRRITCSSRALECDKLASCRSRSLPRPSSTALNPKKRCRSSSPIISRSKRRRITVSFGYSCTWTEQELTSAQPDSDLLARPEASYELQSCSNSHVSSMSITSTVDCGSKQTFDTFCVPAVQNFTALPHQINILCHGRASVADQPSWPFFSPAKSFDCPLPSKNSLSGPSSQDSQRSLSHSTSVCIESALIPDFAALSQSSDSDWDCELVSRMGPASAAPLSPTEQSAELDKELLHRRCAWTHNSSYESRLHTVLQPPAPGASLCGEDVEPSAFSRTVVQTVKVQH
ncbi:uncharacterized protein dbf4b [Betta splendens]|uniref:Uncharacterized protein dbf4b n=1 Tax=Betta splendens TaxID=158456 RepID=A0A6P7L4D2_BETSP|nr:uncharacterized protein dbf4b [Betta splendens]XP_028989432.1 uncharacterized protein dbf4b [Betta splendens]